MLQAQFSHGPGIDNPLSMYRGGQSYYYIKDRLGSVVEISDSSGNIVKTYTYDVWGTIVTQTGSLSNPFKYTSREFDSESGLYYYRARYYSSVIGRFMQKDPIGMIDGPNVYIYVDNNPGNNIDPFGWSWKGLKKWCGDRWNGVKKWYAKQSLRLALWGSAALYKTKSTAIVMYLTWKYLQSSYKKPVWKGDWNAFAECVGLKLAKDPVGHARCVSAGSACAYTLYIAFTGILWKEAIFAFLSCIGVACGTNFVKASTCIAGNIIAFE